MRQVEVAGEPTLDLRVLAHELDELLGRHRVVVVEPAAAVDHVAFLEHAQTRANDRSVREAEYLPAFGGRVVNDGLLEPLKLLVVDEDLVRRVLCRAEHGRSHAHDQSLVGDLVAELRRLLAEIFEVGLQIILIGLELVDALEVVVAANDVKLVPKAIEEILRQLEALTCAGEELLGLRAILGLAQVTQADDEGIGSLVENGLHVPPTLERVVQVARVQVQVAEDGEREVVALGHSGHAGTAGHGSARHAHEGARRSEGRSGQHRIEVV
mmetsp:Transcript_32450/g.73271  ORF Transcript_32450/g.73271 Transcript_32450/m.73271 type:complete len:269 (+) Transcript_32450:1003-1809(+)